MILFKNLTPEHSYFEAAVKNTIIKLNMQLREIAHYIAMMDLVKDRINAMSEKVYLGVSKGYLFCLYIIVPLMVGIKVAYPSKYSSFIKGQEKELFINTAEGMQLKNLFSYLTGSKITNEKEVTQTLERLYIALFYNNIPSEGIEIENILIKPDLKEFIFKIVSFLSKYSTF